MNTHLRRASIASIAVLALTVPPAASISEAATPKPAVSKPAADDTPKDRKSKPSRSAHRAPTSLKDLPTAWQRLAWCESRHNLHAVSPGRTYFGLWQLHKGFYAVFDIDPQTANFAQQWRVAKYVYKRQGARAWSCSRYAGLH